jgi:hypothetical protein
MGGLSDSLHRTPKGAFRRLSYQPGLLASGCDPVHHQLHRHPWATWPMTPTSIFLRHGLPSSAAPVTQLSCVPRGRTCTDFHHNQVAQAFPPARRFLLAHLLVDSVHQVMGWSAGGYSTNVGLVPGPALAPSMQRLAALGANEQIPLGWRPRGVGAGNPLTHCASTITSGCGRVGGPPMHTKLRMGGPPTDQGAIAALGHLCCPSDW